MPLIVFGFITIAMTISAKTALRERQVTKPGGSARTMSLPLIFEEAADAPNTYRTRGRGYQMWIGGDRILLRLRGTPASTTVGLDFVGGRAATAFPEQRLATRVNHLVGARRAWRTGEPAYGRVRLRAIYPGVDATFYGRDDNIEYDLVVAPGASPDVIRIAFDGSDAVVSDGSSLSIRAAGQVLTQHPVTAYQEIGGRRVPVHARYRVNAHEVRFAVGAYDPRYALVLDPILTYSTYFGGSGNDSVQGLVTTASSDLVAVGWAERDDFPIAPEHAHTATASQVDAYAAKFAPDGSLKWLTFFGGAYDDQALGVTMGLDESIYIGGRTRSADFPTTAGAYHTAPPSPGEGDGFVLRLSQDGSTVVASTYLGAPDPWLNTSVNAIRTDHQDRIAIVGATTSPSFPVTIADSRNGTPTGQFNEDAFVARFDADLSQLQFSRLLAGAKWDSAAALTIDRYDAIYVTGSTTSDDFPTAFALNPHKAEPGDPQGGSGRDGFLASIWTDGSLTFSTYLGGTGDDVMTAIVQGQYDRIYVGGRTLSTGLEVNAPAKYNAASGQYSGIVFELVPNGSSIVAARYVYDLGYSSISAITIRRDWMVWIAGEADGKGWMFNSYPDTPLQSAPGGGTDLAVFEWGGNQLDQAGYSALYGGSLNEYATAIAADPLTGDVYFAGQSSSANYPLLNAVESAPRDSALEGVLGRLACYVHEIEPVPVQPASGGGDYTRTYAEAACPISGTSDSPWLHVTGTSGGSATFTTDPNTTTSSRTGNITIVAGRLVEPVTQAAGTGSSGGTGSSIDEIVLNASDATNVSGRWQIVPDPLHGSIVAEADQGDPKLGAPLASPANFFEFTFTADAGKAYHLWIHGLAQNDSYQNDSAWVQFSDSVDGSGNPIWRAGTTDGTFVSLEPCSGCGEQGWGWRDNQYGGGLGPNVVFATSGPHTIRIQQREDGFNIGQVTLSAVKYLTTAPGADRNDSTVLQKPSGTTTPPPIDEIVLYPASAQNAIVSGDWSPVADTSAAGGTRMWEPDLARPKVTAPSTSPANYVDIAFNADAGKAYHLWLRLKADNDSYQNDSVWVQFAGSVDSGANPTYRIGTTAGTFVSLEECSGCGEQGWGWQDNAYGSPGDLGPPIYFAQSGPQTIRIQQREDGVSIDQIVLSAVKYATTSPGANRNDTTTLSKTH